MRWPRALRSLPRALPIRPVAPFTRTSLLSSVAVFRFMTNRGVLSNRLCRADDRAALVWVQASKAPDLQAQSRVPAQRVLVTNEVIPIERRKGTYVFACSPGPIFGARRAIAHRAR